MNDPNVILVLIMGAILAAGLLSSLIKESFSPSIPLLMLIFGIIIGPIGFNAINIGTNYQLVEEATRITLAISLMGVALRIPRTFTPKNWKSIAVVLLLVMPLMFLSSGILVYFIIGLPLGIAMLIGAAVTPTDPVVASSIVTGKFAENKISKRIRHFISVESGANDGLALPFVLLVIFFLEHSHNLFQKWIFEAVLYEVGVALLLGLLIGIIAGYLLKIAEDKKIIEQINFLSYTLAISLLTVGIGALINVDGIFAVFIAGLAFDQVIKGKERAEEEKFQESINRFFVLPIFILIGATIPGGAWFNLGGVGVILCVAILLFRRLPFILALKPFMGTLKDYKDALFVGWFGPIGVAAVYYLSFSLNKLGIPQVWEIGTLIIFSSILVHGITASPITRLYHKREDKKNNLVSV
ncbi:cation:proton antiporter [Methanobacterium sp. ACI-7]|uniref:cation:proton antiporter domain-containing protein n=1 Tax=unclassified Methanobacterium TaxID=2627676 RepID=UPI0039C0AA54